jgi:hypothetical protein
VVGTLPRGVSKSSIADNFGGRVEHGPHFYRMKLQIVSWASGLPLILLVKFSDYG